MAAIKGPWQYRLVIAQKAKLRLRPEVTTALASKTADHRLTASGFFPCSIDKEFLYGYAADGYRSPLWICAAYDGEPVLVHRYEWGWWLGWSEMVPAQPWRARWPRWRRTNWCCRKIGPWWWPGCSHPPIFFTPENLGTLPALWLQATKLTISLAPFQEKFAKLFQTIAVELWLRGRSNGIRDTFQVVARSITIRVAERLARYICSLMRTAATLATPETECLLYESIGSACWSELIGAATETATINRNRAPSGPVKVSVPTQPQERPQGGIRLQFFFRCKHVFFLPHSFFCLKHVFFRLMYFFRIVARFFHLKFFIFPRKMWPSFKIWQIVCEGTRIINLAESAFKNSVCKI